MMKIIVVYNGKTGFTEKYGKWIAQELNCEAVSAKEMTEKKWSQYDTIIYGGSMMAGVVRGLDKVKGKFLEDGKRAVIFAVGAVDRRAVEAIEKFKNDNLTPKEQQKIGFFYLEGGINYEKMGFMPKLLLKMMYKSLAKKADRTAEETGMMHAIEKSADKTDREYIKPLIEYIKNFC